MAEHGCQLLLNFTCCNLDRQGEINIRLPVPDVARVSCPLRLWPKVWSCYRNMAITIKPVDAGREGKSQEIGEG